MNRIGIVEDNIEFRQTLSQMLGFTYFVSEYSSPFNVLEAFDVETPDLILLDLMFSHGDPNDGLTFIKNLKESYSFSKIPIVVISGVENEFIINKALEFGANDYLIKPIKINTLLFKVKNLLDIIHFEETNSNNSRIKLPNEDIDLSFEYIVNQNISTEYDISISNIASKLCMSISTLERKVKEKHNLTPKQYIINKKLNESIKLLQNHSYRIKEVAYELGFSSDSYFCSCFKKKFGFSPKYFQTNNSKKN
ncbi:MAG: helix-turn-helix domain-containing protein [Sphingobacteriia bacterium]